MRKIAVVGAVAAALAAVSLSGCSSVSTQFDEAALHYQGGAASSKKFVECIPASHRQYDGPSEKYYVYPNSIRSFDFTGDKDAESEPIVITAKGQNDKDGNPSGSAQVALPGVATFFLNTSDCAAFRQFHEVLGNKYKAWWGGSDFEDKDTNNNNIPDGWESMLRYVWGNAVKNTAQDLGSQYSWQQLYNDASSRVKLQGEIQAKLNEQIKRLDGSKGVDFFLTPQVTLNQPRLVNKDLENTIVEQQSKVSEANSKKAQADANADAADAQVKVAKAESAQKEELVKVLGIEGYLKQLAIEKGLNPFQPPMVNPGTK